MAVVILSLPSFLLENDFIYHCPPLKWLLYSPSIIVGMKMTSFTIFPFKMAVVLHSFFAWSWPHWPLSPGGGHKAAPLTALTNWACLRWLKVTGLWPCPTRPDLLTCLHCLLALVRQIASVGMCVDFCCDWRINSLSSDVKGKLTQVGMGFCKLFPGLENHTNPIKELKRDFKGFQQLYVITISYLSGGLRYSGLNFSCGACVLQVN